MIDTVTAPLTGAPTSTSEPRPGPIVVGVGGTDPASVLRAARMLELREAGGVVAASVVEPRPAAGVGPEALPSASYVDDQYAATTQWLTERLRATGGSAASWRTRVVGGEPAFALTDLARTIRARVLVMGIGRHRALDRVFGSETTLRAIRLAPCPVLAVHPDLDGPFHDVVAAVDFSVAGAFATQTVVPWLGPETTLHLVHVWRPDEADSAATAAANEAYRVGLLVRFQRLVELLSLPTDVEVKTVTREGTPAERVLDYAQAHHADLVVAGRHSLRVLERLLVGSETTAMLRHAKCSLLIAPEPSLAAGDLLRLALAGTSHGTRPAEWKTQLDALTRRNRGRHVAVEVEDLVFGARVVESGLELVDTAYDPATAHIELTVADPDRTTHRITRVIGGVVAVDLTTDLAGTDRSMHVKHAGGRTSLTFVRDRGDRPDARPDDGGRGSDGSAASVVPSSPAAPLSRSAAARSGRARC